MTTRRAALADLSIEPVALATRASSTGTRSGRLPLQRLYPNPQQPRRQFDAQTILELAADIAANGQLQAIRVRPPDADGRHMIVVGERRWRALQKIDTATTAEVVVDYDIADDDAAYDQALAENLQRDDLTRVEVAAALLNRKERYGLTNEALARRYHKSVAWVDQHMRYAQLPEDTRALMERKAVDLKVAGVLHALDGEAQRALLEAVADLPDQRSQLDFARAMRDFKSSGADTPTAVAAARQRPARDEEARTSSQGGHPSPRPLGRPRSVSVPFAVATAPGRLPVIAVNPRALATTALVGRNSIAPADWLSAVAQDLEAFWNTCQQNGAEHAWQHVSRLVAPALHRPDPERNDAPESLTRAPEGSRHRRRS